MQLPGRSSDDAVEVSREGVPTRRHESTCAPYPSNTIKMHLSATPATTRLPDCCTAVLRVAPSPHVDAMPVLRRRRGHEDSAARSLPWPSKRSLRGGTFMRAPAVCPP